MCVARAPDGGSFKLGRTQQIPDFVCRAHHIVASGLRRQYLDVPSPLFDFYYDIDMFFLYADILVSRQNQLM